MHAASPTRRRRVPPRSSSFRAIIAVLGVAGATLLASAVPAQTSSVTGGTTGTPSPGMRNDTRAAFGTPQRQGAVEYVNGGVGDEGVDRIRSEASDYSLQMLFHGQQGEYVAADQVTIRRGEEVVLDLRNAGPYVLAKLPPGRYTVESRYEGRVQTKTVEVGRQSARLDWTWPSEPEGAR